MRKKYNYNIKSDIKTFVEGIGEMEIPSGTNKIVSNTFYSTEFTKIIIPKSVTVIEAEAIKDCFSLESLEFKGTISQWNSVNKAENWFYRIPYGIKLQCTDGEIQLT